MIENFLWEKKVKHKQLAVFVSLALIVVLITVAALKLTGVAKNNELTMLECPVEIHEHTEECYDGADTLICGYADFVIHTHSLDCYYDDTLICDLPVIEAHEHTDACYSKEDTLVCELAETEQTSANAHTHTDD